MYLCLELKVVGMSHLQGEAFQELQVLAGQVLIGKKEVACVILPRTTSSSRGCGGWASQIKSSR